MKKRYARILAATLSAAMVFTSAPVNFTGIDLGVIEAQAEDSAALTAFKTQLKAAVVAALAKAPTWNGGDQTASKTVTDAAAAAKTALNNAGVTSITLTLNDAGTNGTKKDAGSYKIDTITAAINAEAYEGASGGEVTIDVSDAKENVFAIIAKKPMNEAAVAVPADVYCYAGNSTLYYKNNSGVETALTAATYADKQSGYSLNSSAEDLESVKAGETTTVKVKRTADDKNCTYEGVQGYSASGGSTLGSIVKDITVKVVATSYTAAGELTDKTTAALVECEWGGTNIKIYDEDNKSSKVAATSDWTVVNPEELATYAKGTNVTTVKVQSKKHEGGNVDWAAFKGDTSVAASTSKLSYNQATGRFERYVQLNVTEKTINSGDLVWPDSVAAGTTVKVGDTLADVELVKTESSKYGTFKIVNAFNAGQTVTKAGVGANKCAVTFEPNTNCTIGTVAIGDTSVTEAGGKFTKANAIIIDVTRNTVAEKDIAITAKDSFDSTKVEYGKTIAQIMDDANFKFAGSGIGTYTLSGKSTADVLPIGKTTLTYKFALTDADNQILFNDKSTADVTVDVTVVAPVVKAKAAQAGGATTQTIKDNESATPIVAKLEGFNSDKKTNNATLNSLLTSTNIDFNCQWYIVENGKTSELRGKTSPNFTPEVVLGSVEYYCVMKPTVKASVSAENKALLSQVLEATYTTSPYRFSVTSFATSSSGFTAVDYGYAKRTGYVQITDAGWTIKSAKWSYTDSDNKKYDVATNEINGSKTATTINIPTGLDAGDYTFVCEMVAEKDGKEQVCPVYIPFKVNKAELKDSAWKTVAVKDVKIPYGTTLEKVPFTTPDDSDKLGTYEWVNADAVKGVKEYTDAQIGSVRFVPSDATKKNYYIEKNSNAVYDDPADNINDYEIATIKTGSKLTVEKATLVIKPVDITVDVNGKVNVADVKTDVQGLVGYDSLASLGVKVSYKLADTVDTSKAGTIADAIETTVTVAKAGKFEKVVKTNAKSLLDDYNIEVANGSVIVKAATAPTVAPTPAPVKQATAAAPKAAKAKATVKVGKKYTLKLKYAAGKKATVKKVTWKSSKKSVATVSSKGKVTAKKAGKATITATITFKDGSKKKVKFTVTVK